MRPTRIPTHQIHNVLNAYIRQLKARHQTGHDGGPPENQPADRSLFWSGFTERRWIMDKISAEVEKDQRFKMVFKGHLKWPVASGLQWAHINHSVFNRLKKLVKLKLMGFGIRFECVRHI